jgi:hypothetical protein
MVFMLRFLRFIPDSQNAYSLKYKRFIFKPGNSTANLRLYSME